ncbi:MAG: tRNA pseudouridine(55) synthase TruB [Clostridia bacterium]|nr:tRNA pseudouridine(55) synthase TruB [Clostridia bacterium]
MNGFININKPSGVTSNHVVNVVKRMTNCKVGHFGTLDPLAQGVLPLALGQATKLFDYLATKRKTYIAEFTFGITSDTLDCEGVVTDQCSILPTREQIIAVLPTFTGKIMQLPPQFSALSVNGVRAYKLARQGQEVQLTEREIEIYKFSLLDQLSIDKFTFEIECSAGTYIRSLARDVAQSLSTVGLMSALLRTASGVFTLDKAVTVEQLESNVDRYLLDITYPLLTLPKFSAPSTQFKSLSNGVRISAKNAPVGRFLLYCNDKLFGIARQREGKVVLEYNLFDVKSN